MKKASQKLLTILVVFSGLLIFQACATQKAQQAPSVQTQQTPGIYTHSSPAFSIEYPETWKADKLRTSTEVLRVANTNVYKLPNFVVTCGDMKDDSKLDSSQYFRQIEKNNPGSKRFKAFSEKMVTLNDGTQALAITLKWTWLDKVTKLQSAALLVHKGGKRITVIGTTVLGGETTPDKLLDMCLTFKFL